MKAIIIKHASFEGPDYILDIIKKHNFKYKIVNIYENERLPQLNSFDILIIMGGPMGVYEEEKYPWLTKEKGFIKKAIKQNRKILGICLGAQLIAECLEGKVYKNKYSEIGWFPVFLKKDDKNHNILRSLPEKFITFHWHNDTFALPKGAVHFASSSACKNQAFMFGSDIIGLQFHPEIKLKSLKTFINKFQNDIKIEKYIQEKSKLIPANSILRQNHIIMEKIFDILISS